MPRFIVQILCIVMAFTSLTLAAKKRSHSQIPLEQLRAFAETYWQIKQSYVDKVDDKVLLEGAINGMLQSLDPYSSYLNEEDLMDLQASSDGVYEGLGVEVIAEKDAIKVVNTLDDSPAKKAGILINDLITEVNNLSVDKVGAEEAINSMRGKAGESIYLKIVRVGNSNPLDFNIKRETLEMKSVVIKPLDNGIWHAKIAMFQRDTGYELVKQIREQVKHLPFNGLVVDLRNNPGGVLKAAVDVADLFVEEGVIVSTEGRTSDSMQRFYANPGDELEQIPVVILINERSASASEIVAGALQDHKRGIIIGSQSYGKGLVQSVYPIQANTAIKLTTSRYFTPSGRSIHGTGITPDVALEAGEDKLNDLTLEHAIDLLIHHGTRNLSQK